MTYSNNSNLPQLIVIFGFVLLVVLMKSIARCRRDRMWHETARLAIEKGQPLPPPAYQGCSSSPKDPRRLLLAGLVLIAAGAAAYLVSPNLQGRWFGAVPTFVGVALLLFCLITRGTNRPGDQAPPPGSGLS